MIWHAGDFCQGPEGEQKGPYPKPSVSGWAAREDEKEVGTSSHALDAGPRLVALWWLSELAPGGWLCWRSQAEHTLTLEGEWVWDGSCVGHGRGW